MLPFDGEMKLLMTVCQTYCGMFRQHNVQRWTWTAKDEPEEVSDYYASAPNGRRHNNHTWLGHHFQGQKVKGQLAGGGTYCGGLPHSLFNIVAIVICHCWSNLYRRSSINWNVNMEKNGKISWMDKVTNEEVLGRVNEERKMLNSIW